MKKILSYFPVFVLIFVLIKVLIVTYESKRVLSKGETAKAYIFVKKNIGSKGTIRCYYRFYIGNQVYEGHDDTNIFNTGDSITIRYLPDSPDINRSERFLIARFNP
jgi:hypothetical protein